MAVCTEELFQPFVVLLRMWDSTSLSTNHSRVGEVREEGGGGGGREEE